MNMRAAIAEPASRLEPECRIATPSRGWFVRTTLRSLTFRRLVFGGRIDDAGRLPRYGLLALLGVAALWVPVVAYLQLAPVRYTSSVSLILPGSGASNSISLSEIGQASSFANSAYASPSLSPTVTYKRLLASQRVLAAAAGRLGVEGALDEPRVKLVDQTGLVLLEMRGASPEDAQARAEALTAAFLAELETLRRDEQTRRADSARSAIAEYETAVGDIRQDITRLQRESGLTSSQTFEEIVAGREELAARLRDLDADLEQTTARTAALEAALGVEAQLAALSLKLQADPEFRNLGRAMATAASELAEARGEYGERHPVLIEARDRYTGTVSRLRARAGRLTGLTDAALGQRIDLAADGERASLLAELVRLSAERRGLVAEHAVVADKLANADLRVDRLMEAAGRLDDLQRDYQVAEAVFASALARVDTSKADVFASYPLVQILETASLPARPSSPRKMIAIAAGVAGTFCLFLALALAWLRRPVIDWLIRKATSA
ncbi:MAG: GumC family protein [Paracoccaceae bacterium]